jgi:transposase
VQCRAGSAGYPDSLRDWDTPADPQYEPIDRRQMLLEALDVDALIASARPARNTWELLGRMDLRGFAVDLKSVEGRAGHNAWEPRLVIALWLYAYSRGISSAREIERECRARAWIPLADRAEGSQ